MQIATLILSILAVIIAVLSFVFRKPGPQGKQGETGLRGIPGEDGHDGDPGVNGKDGKDGVTPRFKIEKGVLRVTYNEGKTYQDLGKVKGEKGPKGDPGKDAVVIDGAKEVTREVIEAALIDEDGQIRFNKSVSALSFHQEN